MCEQIVLCIARDEVKAARILDDLRHAGFPETKISVLVPEMAVAGGFVPLASSESSAGAAARTDEHLLGGALGGLFEAGVLVRPDLGRLIGAGPLMAALNAPRLDAPTGHLVGELVRAGVPAAQAQYFRECLREGKILLSIHCDQEAESVRSHKILAHSGADDVVIGKARSGQESHGIVKNFQQAA